MNDIFQEVREIEEIARFTPPPPARVQPGQRIMLLKAAALDTIEMLRFEITDLPLPAGPHGDYATSILPALEMLDFITDKINEL